jgi:nucleoside-diphosphate-sugar epimerase
MKIFVTGASGLIGSVVAPELIGENGVTVGCHAIFQNHYYNS